MNRPNLLIFIVFGILFQSCHKDDYKDSGYRIDVRSDNGYPTNNSNEALFFDITSQQIAK